MELSGAFVAICLQVFFLFQCQVEGGLFACVQYWKCHCTEQVISCVGSNIQQVPIFSPFLISLNLSQNALFQVKPTALHHLSLLETLDLSYNRVRNLTNFTFSGLANLQKLYLNDNQIDRIEKNCFKNAHQLRELHLQGNALLHLDGDVFFDLQSLERLIIWHANAPITTAPENDDRARLCQCASVQEIWHVEGNFAFCQRINIPQRTVEANQCQIHSSLTASSTLNQTLVGLALEQTEPTAILESNASSNVTSPRAFGPKVAPMLTRMPDYLVRVASGSSLTWTCGASGTPKPMLRWLQGNRIVSKNSTLNLHSIGPTDEGIYECVASNEAGVAAREVTLYVTGGTMADQYFQRLSEIVTLTAQGHPVSRIERNRHIESSLQNITQFVQLVRSLVRQSDDGSTFLNGNLTRPILDWLTPVQQMVMNNYTGCVGGTQAQVLDCQKYLRYRSITGICNNIKYHPMWGSIMIPFTRLLPARYEDGLVKPVGWFASRKYGQHRLPNAKMVTEKLLSTSQLTPDPVHNHMLMQFGQFLDHDLTFTAQSRNWNILEDNVVDCRKTCRYVEPCFSVGRFWNRSESHKILHPKWSACIEVVRSAEMCGTGFTSLVHGRLVPREQVNSLTAYIDGSNIYGSTVELARYLRDLNPNDGLLKSTQINGEIFMPLSDEHFPLDCQLQPKAGFMDCFLAGDHRVNEHIGLLAFHNLWLRQHNRLATKMRKLFPTWSGDRIYEETRKIIGAQLQIITYRDWLPIVLGKEEMLGLYTGYKSTVDASISNVFATAAMRFGHTLVNGRLVRQFASNSPTTNADGDMKLRKLFFASHLLYQPKVADSVLVGLLAMPLKKPMPEQAISSELTEHLFERSRQAPLDLASLNIQRGRDHALPSYNQWRAFCGLGRVNTFAELENEIHSSNIRTRLQQLYGHPENIDLWVGAILEEPADDAKVGPTFRCLLANQFSKIRDGDRHFYKAASMFTKEQLMELEKTQLSKIICANTRQMNTTVEDAFVLSNQQEQKQCDQLADLDLTKWK